jgi:TldD protein
LEALEVVRGKIVGRVKDVALQFQTRPFWQSLKTLGDAGTVYESAYSFSKGIPWKRAVHTTSAPAGLFTNVHIVGTGLRF